MLSMTASQTAQVTLRIPAKAEYIVLCRLALSGIARTRSIDDEVLADLKLALTEACTNSVRHAYPDDAGVVDVRYELADDRLCVEVTDLGPGFDPDASASVDGELDEGGLGLAIIRALVDDLEIAPAGGGGSRLRFTKYIS